jgi:hypothetical protein
MGVSALGGIALGGFEGFLFGGIYGPSVSLYLRF